MPRIFIVGNGASLNETPLYLLSERGEHSFGMNKIHLIYPTTIWRPTHYFLMDLAPYDDAWMEYAARNEQAKRFLWDGWNIGEDANYVHQCKKHHFYASDNLDKRVTSWHLPEICTAFNSIYTMMQLSVMMGYDEIFLLGCDLWGNGENHFTPDYARSEDIERRNRDALYLHQVSKQSCPVPIVNCTVGGSLEVYPRRTLESVLNDNQLHTQ